jgi:ribonuclease BN (tRNA processing enzyme)
MLRVECANKVITYTGDTDWTAELIAAAAGADLLISECYFYEKPIKMHMIYKTLKQHLHELNANRVVLTHMSQDMLRHVHDIPEECAYDGMIIEL